MNTIFNFLNSNETKSTNDEKVVPMPCTEPKKVPKKPSNKKTKSNGLNNNPSSGSNVDDWMNSMSGLFRRATNLIGFTGNGLGAKAPPLDDEIVYCKNNVCVHPPAVLNASPSEEHHPGYLTIRCQHDEVLGKTLILTWIPNSTLRKHPQSISTSPTSVLSSTDESGLGCSSNGDVISVSAPVQSATADDSEMTPIGQLNFNLVPDGDTPIENGCDTPTIEVNANEVLSSVEKIPSPDRTTFHLELNGKEVVEGAASSPDSSEQTSGPDTGPSSFSGDEVGEFRGLNLENGHTDDPSPCVDYNMTFPNNAVVFNRCTSHSTNCSSSNASSSGPRGPGNAREQSCGVFSVDLGLMRSVRLFYSDAESGGRGRSGQVVIASPESQYKVLHFHAGGLDRLEQILEEWKFFARPKSKVVKKQKAADDYYRQYTVVRPHYTHGEKHPEEGHHALVSRELWGGYVNGQGQIEECVLLRKAIFFGGLDPSLRGEVWPFLLKFFPFNSTTEERLTLAQEAAQSYTTLKLQRHDLTEDEQESFYRSTQCIVEKDVVRTDRGHSYYSGESNPNLEVLKEILLTYALAHPEYGYSQGMSDLLAPLLAEIQCESTAYWCFEGLMQRTTFVISPTDTDMDTQLNYFRHLLSLMAPAFYKHLRDLGGDALELLFCHRWILLCFKREFSERDALRLWEACWAHYQTDYFHLFICVAIVLVYGSDVIEQKLPADEMLLHFASLALHMDAGVVLVKARYLLHAFRARSTIPCVLSGLCTLCGPGMWDSGYMPSVECVGHEDGTVCPHAS